MCVCVCVCVFLCFYHALAAVGAQPVFSGHSAMPMSALSNGQDVGARSGPGHAFPKLILVTVDR